MIEPIFSKNLSFARFATFNEKPHNDVFHLHQIHSPKVVPPLEKLEKADGMVFSKDFQQDMAIVTADCMPIVVEGENGIAFLHAGWRGLAQGILTAHEVLNLKPINFFFGPHIAWENYEVQEDFRGNFPPGDHFIERENKLYFDLDACARMLIKEAFPAAHMESAKLCTFAHPELHSYRKDGTAKRNWNLLIPFQSA